MPKINCWEFKKCGREPGGEKTNLKGDCPAATEKKLNGVLGGKNAGRTCWVVAGTLCRGNTICGTFAEKEHDCLMCDFYLSVRSEGGKNFISAGALLKKIRK